MCGIAGVRRYGKEPITAQEVKTLLCQLEHRGNHATGIALMVNREVKLIKAAVPAWSFIAQKDTLDFLEAFLPDATMALLHTRFATVGNPGDNANNHPMFLGNSAVVHNGSISNHAYLFDSVLKVPRSCETDSDVFRAAFDKEGLTRTALETLNKGAGSAAIAAISQDTPDLLVLARSGSPLIYGITEDKLWWASELRAIQAAVRPWVVHHGLTARKSRSDVAYFSMPDNTAYILGTHGRTERLEFKTCTRYVQPIYNARATYAEKKRSFEATAKPLGAEVLTHKSCPCPKHDCNARNIIARTDKWFRWNCHLCNTPLRALDNLPETDMTFVPDSNFAK